ncbi:MAG: SDR family oxidoreductase [bacterium]|nr:SDR family oxidoreductase [bacterium]
MANLYDLKNKKILITGANGQLGKALVEALLLQGAFVYATDLQPSGDASLQKKNCQYLAMDVTSEQSIKDAFKKIDDLDVLVNNAGVAVFSPFESRTVAEIDQVMDVNLKGTILCSQIASARMVGKKKGKIVNIGSIYGTVPADKKIYGDSGRNSSEIYAATKAGVTHFTKYLAAYLAEHNIQVNTVSPGGIFNNQKQAFVDNYVAKTPAGRMAQTSDLVGIICFLASDDSDYLTGQNITVDGGFTLNQ